MSATTLVLLAVVGWCLASFGSLGTKILSDFSWHDLKVYSRLRRRRSRFEEIVKRYEQVSLGAEGLQAVGVSLLVIAGIVLAIPHTRIGSVVSFLSFVGVVFTCTLILLAATSWIPWAIVRIWSVSALFHTWPAWSLISKLLWPLGVGVNVFDSLVRRLAGRPKEPTDEEEAFEDEIRTMVTAGHHEGLLEADAREMIEGVIELGDTDVADIMTTRSNIDAFEINMGWEEILQFVVSAGRTRIPVYEQDLDNIIGVLFVKDLLAELSGGLKTPRRGLPELLRDPWFVPPTKPVDDMLKEFLNTRSHLAIVVDEYRRVAGVVTIEDVLEEIVGEIVDETDRDHEEIITRINGTTAEALGTAHLDELNERLGLELPESDDFDTVAGLVLQQLGRIPKAGEFVVQGNVRIAVLEASKRRIQRVRIETIQNGR